MYIVCRYFRHENDKDSLFYGIHIIWIRSFVCKSTIAINLNLKPKTVK